MIYQQIQSIYTHLTFFSTQGKKLVEICYLCLLLAKFKKLRKAVTIILLLTWLIAGILGLSAQESHNVPSSGNQSVHTCNAWIYDSGGANGSYTSYSDGYLVIYPASGGDVVSITSGSYYTESGYDYLKIYNGVGTNGTLLVTLSGNGTLGNSIASSDPTGALTICFQSDGSVNYSGFALRVQCVTPVVMSSTQLTGCSYVWMDPGGMGNYANNQDVTQTFCSDNGDHVQVNFSSFSLSSGDYLRIYDGNSTASALIGSYTGTTLPPEITSSGSCLTFKFTSNNSGVNSGWVGIISCSSCPAGSNPVGTGQGSPCAFENIHPFCTDQGQYTYYSGTTGTAADFFGTGDVGCLGSTPAPAWYYMRIQDPGNMTIYIQQYSLSSGSGIDVDFACWGPFSASTTSNFIDSLCCGLYNLHTDDHPNNTSYSANYPYGNLVDCSFDARTYEYCHINGAQVGEYYLLLITNYSQLPGVITFSSTSGSTATTDCSIMAEVSNTGPYCVGDSAQLICNNPQIGATYSWVGPNGWTSSEVNPVIFPVTVDMDGNTYGLVKSMDGTSSDTAYTTIRVMTLNTVITVSPSDTVCSGQQVTLSTACDIVSSEPVTGVCSNSWSPGGQQAGTVTVTPTVTTTYVLQQTFGNCVGRDSVTIEIRDPSTEINASDTVICLGDTVTLSAHCAAGSSCTYQWIPGNQTSATVQLSPTTTTPYILRQTIDGCLATDTVNIRVNMPDVNTDTVYRTVPRDSLPYVFSGQTYADTGTYAVHLTNVHGCDSSITFVLQLLDSIFVNLDSVVCPESFPFQWNGITFNGDSVVTLALTAHDGADSIVQLSVSHYPNPIRSLAMTDELCAGDTLSVSIGVSQSSNLVFTANAAIQSGSQKIFIPDGISCAPYGTLYRSIALFNQFVPGSTMSSVNDILYVRLKMEHSALEDLKLSIVCPNGNRSKLIADYDNITSSWGNVANNYFRTCLGLANRLTDVVTCDSTQNPIGEPWNYIWSNNTNHNYQYAAGTYGYCYEAVNLQSYANPYWDFNSTWQQYYDSYTTHKSVKPSDPVNMTQIYHPYQSFNNLIGCPLNGQWYIEVQDLLEEDNGYLTEWELALAPSLLQTLTPAVVSTQLIGPWVTALSDSTYIITPPADLLNDTTVVYRFVLHSDAGCTYDTTAVVTVHPVKMVALDTTICDTELPLSWEGQTFLTAGERTLDLQTAHGCDSTVTLRLLVTPSSYFTDTVFTCDTYTWQNGVTYTSSTNEPTVTLTNAVGCDSVVRLLLVVYNSVETVDEVFACDSVVWIDGNTYYESTNEPVHVIEMETGCDSIVTLHLTLGHSAATDTTAEACGIFSWYEHKNILASCDNLTHVFSTPEGCDSIVTLHLTIFPIPEACFNFFTLGDNYEVETPLHFEECVPGMVDYHWNLGNDDIMEEPAFDYVYNTAGSYWVTLQIVDENGCAAEKSRIVVIKNPEMQIYIPSSFTPNRDGLNEVFKPTGMYITDDHYLFMIYDRWGEVVFMTTNPQQGWDGTYKGTLVPNNSVMTYTLRCVSDMGMVRRKGAVVVTY